MIKEWVTISHKCRFCRQQLQIKTKWNVWDVMVEYRHADGSEFCTTTQKASPIFAELGLEEWKEAQGPPKRNLSTPESREFWDGVDRMAERCKKDEL